MKKRLRYIIYFVLVALAVGITGACTTAHSTKRGRMHKHRTTQVQKKQKKQKRKQKKQKQTEPKHQLKEFAVNADLNSTQKALMKEALDWQGTPYQYGGAEKGEGTDCSGLVVRVYLDVTEVKLPRTSAQLAEYCLPVKPKYVQPCDLVFFATGSDPERVSHVGMVLDEENFIHASSSKGVTITRFDNAWWQPRILGFGRVPAMQKKKSSH